MCGFIFTNEFIPAELKFTLHISFPGGSRGKETSCHAGHLGLISGSGRSPGEGKGYPVQYSGLENPMDRGAWRATVHGVSESQTRWVTNTNTIYTSHCGG